MLRTLESGSNDPSWLGAYAKDFHRRFLSLLSFQFRSFGSVQALSIDESATTGINLLGDSDQALDKKRLDEHFTPFDLKRLDSYASNMLDYHVILDLMPSIAQLYFTGRIKNDNGIRLSGVQQALLCAIGLQRKVLEDVEKDLGLGTSQLLAMFVKVIRKVSLHFRAMQEGAIAKDLPHIERPIAIDQEPDTNGVVDLETVGKHLEEELAEGGAEFDEEEKQRMRAMIDSLPLEHYATANGHAGWEDAERQVRDAQKSGRKSNTVSVKSGRAEDQSKRKAGEALAAAQEEADRASGKHKKPRKGR
jgi:N-acetyltransferase 10